MEFSELIRVRQSTRSYDPTREVEEQKIERIQSLSLGRLQSCRGGGGVVGEGGRKYPSK